MWHIDLPHFAHFFAPFSEQLFMFDICTSLAHIERIKNLCLNFFHKLHLSPHHNNFWLVLSLITLFLERTPSLRRQQQNRRPNSSYIPTSSWNVEDLDFGTVIQRPQITKL